MPIVLEVVVTGASLSPALKKIGHIVNCHPRHDAANETNVRLPPQPRLT